MDIQYQPTHSSKKDDGELTLYILLAPSHHHNECQNLAIDHQKTKIDRYKRLILGLPP